VLRDGNNPRTTQIVTNCASCLAWGRTYSQLVCLGCYNFAVAYKVSGACGACGRTQLLKKGHCRLCWCQAYRDRTTGPDTPLAPWVAKVRHHQLFFAELNPGVSRRQAAPKAFPRRYGAKGRPFKAPPPAVGRPRVDGIQLPLFDPGPRRYHPGRIDLRNGPPPGNPWLAWALHLAYVMGEARGFNPVVSSALQRSLVMLLADYTPGERIRRADYEPVLRLKGASIAHASQVLADMGILDEGPSLFDTWLDPKLDGLAPAIAHDTRRWAIALKDGGPRSRPRPEDRVKSQVRSVRPALTVWSQTYDHLREVTRADVVASIEALEASQRQNVLGALRSLFRWAKKHGVVFANPTARLHAGRRADTVWQPLLPEEIGRTLERATTLQARVFVVLAAVHAARPGAIRTMTLDDVDLANGRLTLAGRSRPLDDLTRRVLTEWLDYRRTRWPRTANLHLLVSRESAIKHGPVSAPWVGRIVQGLPGTIERLRIDRQLEEAMAVGGDPLHLAAVFGISDGVAVRYAENARQLLDRPYETDSVASAPTAVSNGHLPPFDHLGSS
jgi:integrase